MRTMSGQTRRLAALLLALASTREAHGLACASYETEAECKGCTDAGYCTWTEDAACVPTKRDGCGSGEGSMVGVTVLPTNDGDAASSGGAGPMPLPTGGGDAASSSGMSGSAGSAPSGSFPCADAMDTADTFVKCTAPIVDKDGACAVAKDFVLDEKCLKALNTLAEVPKYVAEGLAGCKEPVPDTLLLTPDTLEKQAVHALRCVGKAATPEPMPLPEPGTALPSLPMVDPAVSSPIAGGKPTDDAVHTFAPGAPETQRGSEGAEETVADAVGGAAEEKNEKGPIAAGDGDAASSPTSATATSTTNAAPSTAAPAQASAFRSNAAVFVALGFALVLLA